MRWQKNWTPFEWEGALLLGYSLTPHEILYSNLISGECISFASTLLSNHKHSWKWGELRGGTPASLVDGEYLAFFHSSIIGKSAVSNQTEMHHYFMGAYTFSGEPPFQIKKISPSPIIGPNFYTKSQTEKKVIFPGGYVVRDKYFYLAYGKDDCEIWIATIDREKLKKHLLPVSKTD